MATFTLEGEGNATKENIKAINAHWRVFKRWLKRNVGLEDFTWVNEQGKLHGRLHKHALLRSPRISYRAARRAILRAGFGRVCDFTPIRTQRAARFYVSKYLAKSLPVKWPRYSRRCQTSCPKEASQPGWVLQKLLRMPHRATWTMDRRAQDFQEAMNSDLEREMTRLGDTGLQLALIPNMKKCVKADDEQGSFDGFGHDSG